MKVVTDFNEFEIQELIAINEVLGIEFDIEDGKIANKKAYTAGKLQ